MAELLLGTAKSAGNSRTCRVEGNGHFRSEYFKAALEQYNEALLKAPPDSEEFFLAISNRIAANLELGNLEACLRDGQRMLEDANTRRDLRSKTEKRMKKATDILNKEPSRRNTNRPKQIVELYKGPNKLVPALSQAVTIRYNEEKGRHLVATQDIPPGSVVLIEEPYSSFLYPECANTHCHYCHVELPADRLPCKVCSDKVWFCSEMCRDKCWNEYHWNECGFWKQWIIHPESSLVAVRAITVTDPTKLIELEPGRKQKLDKKWAQFGANGEYYCSDSYDTVARLESHHGDMDSGDLLILSSVAHQLMNMLSTAQYFEKAKWPERCHETRKGRIMNNLMRLLEQCECNSFRMCKVADTLEKLKSFERAEEEFTENIAKTGNIINVTPFWDLAKLAWGLYPTGSLFNHSCVRNCASSFFNGRTLVMRTVTELKKDDELKICYWPAFGDVIRDERHKCLEKIYFFKCDCAEACNNKEAEAIEKETIGMMCPKCKIGPALELIEGERGWRGYNLYLMDVKCMNCGAVSRIDNTAIQTIQLSIAMKLLTVKKRGSPNPHSVKELLKDLRDLSEKLHPMHNALVHFRVFIANYCMEAGCYEESHILIMENIKCTDRLYGPDSIKATADIVQVINLLKVLKGKRMKFIPELKDYCKRVAGIYAVYYGPDFPLVKEIECILEQ